jgi:hypothetical protein
MASLATSRPSRVSTLYVSVTVAPATVKKQPSEHNIRHRIRAEDHDQEPKAHTLVELGHRAHGEVDGAELVGRVAHRELA